MTKTKLISLLTIGLALSGCIYALMYKSEVVTSSVNTSAQTEIKTPKKPDFVPLMNTQATEPAVTRIVDEKTNIISSVSTYERPKKISSSTAKKVLPPIKVSKVPQSQNDGNSQPLPKVEATQELSEAKGGFAMPELPETETTNTVDICSTRSQNNPETELEYCI